MAPNIIPTHREICFNCSNMLWMVGIGQGLKCRLTSPPKVIEHREHTCDKFESKHNPPTKELEVDQK